ncbi:MAG TPA: STAS domain-containing protein [Kofleriaceae bacterium]|nr:STAS domain-containing protein [Kofleriaceae bacterium]
MQSDLTRVPIIKVWDILLVPLQGEITDDVAAQVRSEVLDRIHNEGATGLVIDVTALWVMDSHLCSVISRLAMASALMGARTFLCGMTPDVALTIHAMGLELDGVATALSLEEALETLGVVPPAPEIEEEGLLEEADGSA